MYTNRIRKFCIHAIGWGVIGLILYVCLCLLLFVVAINLPKPVKIFPLFRYQSFYYFMGGRNIWQFDTNCAQPDNELIYKPREGACHFTNLEFDTTLHFDANGRAVPAREQADLTRAGIAVLGDSYGMGWGVEDEETFANVLQQSTSKPVFNLSVSSYGTERELKRLAVSGLADKVDTVVILYCENDIGENQLLKTPQDYAEAVKSWSGQAQMGEGFASYEDKLEFVREVVQEVLIDPALVPFQRLWSLVERYLSDEATEPAPGRDFAPHLVQIRQALARYAGLLAGKKVYVAYVTPGGIQLSNFPVGADPILADVRYAEPSLSAEDFFVIDDHLNATGHRHLGQWLVTVLEPGAK